MPEEKAYIPIDCSYYDRLEAWATMRENVSIELTQSRETMTGIISDLYVREKVEYLKLDSGLEIRLDHIQSVNGILLTGACAI